MVAKVVRELMEKLESRTVEAVRGALNKQKRTSRPRFSDIDWPRTIRRNLQHWQEEHKTIVPERLVGYGRHARRSNLEEVILCVDQSGSMATSVVYSSIFAAVLASVPAIATRLVVYDTAVVDLTDDLKDPVDVLFGVQLGGGNDTPLALAYCERLVSEPARTHLILVSDLYEGALSEQMLSRLQAFVNSGVSVIVLLALSDQGRPSYDAKNAAAIAAMGCPVFACTPDQFPDLMATALKRRHQPGRRRAHRLVPQGRREAGPASPPRGGWGQNFLSDAYSLPLSAPGGLARRSSPHLVRRLERHRVLAHGIAWARTVADGPVNRLTRVMMIISAILRASVSARTWSEGPSQRQCRHAPGVTRRGRRRNFQRVHRADQCRWR